ncbi:MAG TPA: thioredoxin domain-containing protein [Hyphomonas sp.]|nr:thioredoxin domain-containing protein [Hyphomonas sp.]HRK68844.1 thioredoxin domain-containing protein [Hyphomonas sp.]
MASLTRRLALLALPVLALVACGAASGDGGKTAAPASGGAVSSEIGHFKGAADAPITLIEYASPTCPACKYFHTAVLPELEEKYISTGKLKYVLREYPLHGNVDIAAFLVARCAGPDKFFDVMDDLFASQEGVVQAAQIGALTATLKTIGKRHGIETDEAFDACMKEPQHRVEMSKVYATAEKYNVGGTPTFVLDGKVRNFEGDFRTAEGFSKHIDALLAEKGVE